MSSGSRLPFFGEPQRPLYYTRSGEPMTLLEWAAVHELPHEQRMAAIQVALTRIEPEFEISTVWLGLDHDCSGAGPPLVFETVVFARGENVAQRRYSTELEAAAGHEEVVAGLRQRLEEVR